MRSSVEVSVIVPVYNAEKYIGECVESILKQTYKDFELILVDDESTDSSLAICRELAARDSRIKIIEAPHGGLSCARNRGIAESRAEKITFVDADDALHPQALEILEEIMDETGSSIVSGQNIHGENCEFKAYTNWKNNFYSQGSLDAVNDTLYQKIDNSAWARLYKKSIFPDSDWFRPGLYYEDLEFFYRAYLRCDKISRVNLPLYFYRRHPESFLHTWSEKRLDVLKVVDEIETFVSRQYPELINAARDRKYSANYNMFLRASENGRNDVADRCWAVVRSYRSNILRDPNSRLKNKAGAILSYFGRGITSKISQWLGM